MKRSALLLLLVLAVSLAPGVLQGAPIIGTLRIGGEAEVTLTTIDWAPIIPGAPLNGTGDTLVIGEHTGIFSPLAFANVGTLVDRDPSQVAGSPILVPNWLTFASLPGLALDLTYIVPGQFGSAQCAPPANNADTCTPAAPPPFVSPYNLSNYVDSSSGLSSNANFSVNGQVRNTSTGEIVGAFSGTFGATFAGKPLEQVLAEVTGAPGFVMAGYDAYIVATAIPEPGSAALAMMGGVLLLAGTVIRRRYQ